MKWLSHTTNTTSSSLVSLSVLCVVCVSLSLRMHSSNKCCFKSFLIKDILSNNTTNNNNNDWNANSLSLLGNSHNALQHTFSALQCPTMQYSHNNAMFNSFQSFSHSLTPFDANNYYKKKSVQCLESTSMSMSSNGRKVRRNRTVFTELQLMGLETRFDTHKYLSTPDRAELARALGLTQLQVKTWYQNRRMKWKKQVMMGGCAVAPTKPKGRPKKNSIPSFGHSVIQFN